MIPVHSTPPAAAGCCFPVPECTRVHQGLPAVRHPFDPPGLRTGREDDGRHSLSPTKYCNFLRKQKRLEFSVTKAVDWGEDSLVTESHARTWNTLSRTRVSSCLAESPSRGGYDLGAQVAGDISLC